MSKNPEKPKTSVEEPEEIEPEKEQEVEKIEEIEKQSEEKQEIKEGLEETREEVNKAFQEKPEGEERISLKKESLSEKDKKIADDLNKKLEKIKSFEPSGDIVDDFNEILDLTGRNNLYKKVDQNTPPKIILAGLSAIRDSWQEILRDSKEINSDNLAKKLFYIDVPQEEIRMVNKVINYYIERLSSKK